jgi:hypothetical protein
MHTGNLAALENWEVVWRYDVERQQRLAEDTVARFAEGLRHRGVEIEVQIYSGGLRTILENTTRTGNVRLVVIPVRDAFGLIRLGRLLWNAFTLMNRPRFSRVVLLHPNQMAQR